MIKIGLNGFGRIGRAIFRANQEDKFFDIKLINDIDPDVENHAYLLEFDCTYGRFDNEKINIDKNSISISGNKTHFTSFKGLDEVPWEKYDIDLIIDATGIENNVVKAENIINSKRVKKIIFTFCPKSKIDGTFLYGVNFEKYKHDVHNILSSSICDANAVAPFFKILDQKFGIELGEITTLHPWLGYQNLLDGTIASVSNPGHFWTDYALGRSSLNNLIPKETRLIDSLEDVIPNIKGRVNAISFRTPTSIVSAADGVFLLKNKTSIEEINEVINDYQIEFPGVLEVENRSLVSIDFKKTKCAATIDNRWLKLNQGKLLKFVLWYDNEYGYSSRTLNLARKILLKDI